MIKTALISHDGLYRFRLTRQWGAERFLAICMLNPSTADHEIDDPTIRKCIGFAKSWGYGGIIVVNLYAFRATKPKDLWEASDPVGFQNNLYLLDAFASCDSVWCAWGANAKEDRAKEVLDLMEFNSNVFCIGKTKAGQPLHPLMQAYSAKRIPI